MRNQIMFSVLALVLVSGVVGITEAAKKKYEATVIIDADRDSAKCIDDYYARISDSRSNPKNGEHDKLVGKFTKKNPEGTITHIEKKIKIDPKNVPSGLLREYATGEFHDQLVIKDYKHPYTPLADALKEKKLKFVHDFNGVTC
jgi:hypothetical protein